MKALFVSLIVAAAACGAEIGGPNEAPTCSGFVEFTTTVQPGHSYSWITLEPDNLDVRIWPDSSMMLFAAPRKATNVRAVLIDVSIEFAEEKPVPKVAIAHKTCRIIGEDPEPEPPNPGPPDRASNLLIIRESAKITPAYADVFIDVAARDNDFAPIRSLITIFDDDTTSPTLKAYAMAYGQDQPVLVVDDDWDPSTVLFAGRCPDDSTELKRMMKPFVPELTITEPAPPASEFTIETIEGQRYGVLTATGEMFPVDEQAGTFSAFGKDYLVTSPKRKDAK